ncbi:MAG: hypothetical protein PHV08_01545 [Sulfurovaceae bacterium]|nr:hypothetical protein [Sulfurovaceae bacterium]
MTNANSLLTKNIVDGAKMYLYRGMDINMYNELNGELIPRGIMTTANLYPGEHLSPSENLFPGNHYLNAIDKHQNPLRYDEDDFKNNSAYLSTTPHLEHAKYYATKGNTIPGYVFYINRSLLANFNINEYIVSESATIITVPEDDEVLLLTNPVGTPLLKEVIIKVERIEPSMT